MNNEEFPDDLTQNEKYDSPESASKWDFKGREESRELDKGLRYKSSVIRSLRKQHPK